MLPSEIRQKEQEKEMIDPNPEFLTNGIMLFFLGDHRFLYIQKRYEPNKKMWYQRIKKDNKNFDSYDTEVDNYYVHKHKDVIKIDTSVSNKNSINKEDKNALIPSTNIWIGLLRLPITTGNLIHYYTGKYTTLKGTFDDFLARYFMDLKKIIVTKTNGDLSKKEDVLVEKWYIYSDIPNNQAVFIL
jgi:hypothetical protein